MSIIKDFPEFLHGGDYNPDQWLKFPGVTDDDFRLMEEASCNAFSIGIFSWGQIEKEEGTFDFSWLDGIMERCAASGKKVFLATPSGGRPAWLGCNYQETNRVDANGIRARWGIRHNHCWTSPVMREKTANIDRRLAERYAGHPALGGWHISNEYNGACFCELCLEKFRQFLQKRYGTLDQLNEAYWSAFWSHTFTDWSQVNPSDPSMDTARLDWERFKTWQIVDFMKMEVAAVREFSAAPATTNMMGANPRIDYWRIAECCDFIADDCYPAWRRDNTEEVMNGVSFSHDMHYSMLNKPFVMLESCPGVPNYLEYCQIRRPNEFEREMLLAIGHGADGTMYFQWRKGLGNCEKAHGAVVGQDNSNQTLTFRRVAEYGRKLKGIAEITDAEISPEAAVIFDWESRWALELTRAYGDDKGKKTLPTILSHYNAFGRQNVSLAVIESACDFTPYKLLAAPLLFMLKPGVAERLEQFVKNGGTLVMTCLSAYVDHNNHCFWGGSPGGAPMKKLLGIRNEDIDCFEPSRRHPFRLNGFELGGKNEFEAVEMAELLHLEGAKSLAAYTDEFFSGVPAITVNRVGKGNVYYLGARTGLDFLTLWYEKMLTECNIPPLLAGIPATLRVARRSSSVADYYFIYNLTAEEQCFHLPFPMADCWNGKPAADRVVIPPSGATILKNAANS